jgi:FkbM family methyltransferase
MTRQPKHRPFKDAIRAVRFAFYSLFSPRVRFTVFFRCHGQWFARTQGVVFPVNAPRLEALEYFRHFVPRPGALVFDVGGELGLETRQLAHIVGPAGRVLVFECFPSHVRKLRELARELPGVTVVERACWNEEKTLEFFTGSTAGSNTALPDVRGQRGQALAAPELGRIEVQAETLDALWRRLAGSAPVEFLKMDIEGAEYEALDGARELLAHTRLVAVAAYHQRDGVPTAAKVAEKLRAAGFEVRCDENLHVYGRRRE